MFLLYYNHCQKRFSYL